MDTLKHFNTAMAYIESKLDGDIDFRRVAALAACSEHHFRRTFSFLSGMSLREYIRWRRMSLAAAELGHGDLKVIDLALKYGYSSPDAFSRAFQDVHGITPSEARGMKLSRKGMAPMTFQLTIRGGNEMTYRVVRKEAFHIVGMCRRLPNLHEGVNPEIAAMWESLRDDEVEALYALADAEPSGLLSVVSGLSDDRGEGALFDYIIGVASTKHHSGPWYVLPVPASTWAVFTARGEFPRALNDSWARIYAEWLPSSAYEFLDGPEIVWTADEEMSDLHTHNEIWVPVSPR